MHLLFIWEQGAGYGHMAHILPIARLARDRGHKVSLAVRNMETVRAMPDLPFDRVVPAPAVPMVPWRHEARTFADVIRPAGFARAETVAACTRGWLQIFDLLRPDAVMCEFAFNAVYAARLRGLPTGRLGTGFSVPRTGQPPTEPPTGQPPTGQPMPSLRLWQPAPAADCQAADQSLLAVLRDAADMLGGPACPSLAELLEYGEEFVVSWPELDHMGVQPERFYYGPMLGLSGQEQPVWPQGRGPRVFMYLGEGHKEQAAILDALGRLGWPAIYHARQAPGGALAANISYVARPLDIQAALGDADMLIGHGSHGISADALRHGCAMLLLPDTLERSMVAYRLTRQELARVPSADQPDAAVLAADLQALADHPLAATARLKARYAGYDPVTAALELLTDFEDYSGAA